MPNQEDILNQISTELTRVQNEPIRITTTGLEYACGQLKFSRIQADTAFLQKR